MLGAALAACSNDSTGPATPQFKIDSGAVTIAAPGQQIRYVIQLLTTGGQPMPDEPITAMVIRGRGQLNTPNVQLTDSTGRLRIWWQLGLEADTQALQLAMEAGPRSTITVPTGALHGFLVDGGRSNGCAFDAGGTLPCWKDSVGNAELRAVPLAGAPRLQPATISSSGRFGGGSYFTTCAIDYPSQLWCWGDNSAGRLGRGTAEPQSDVPAPVTGTNLFRQVSVGGMTVCAVTVDSAGFCWGYGQQGQLGNGDTLNSSVPQPVAGGLRFAQVATNVIAYACGLTAAGDVWCWGRSDYGRGSFGNLPDSNYTTPVLVQSGYGFVEIATDDDVTCGRTALGMVWCWGDNWAGAVGDPGAPAFVPVPVQVVGGHKFMTISRVNMGDHGFYALENTGSVFAWGGFSSEGCSDVRQATPFAIAASLRFNQVSGTNYSFCGTIGDGTVYCADPCGSRPPSGVLPPS